MFIVYYLLKQKNGMEKIFKYKVNVLLSSWNFLPKSCSFNLSKVLLLIEGTMIKVLNISHFRRNIKISKIVYQSFLEADVSILQSPVYRKAAQKIFC